MAFQPLTRPSRAQKGKNASRMKAHARQLNGSLKIAAIQELKANKCHSGRIFLINSNLFSYQKDSY
jgi:hypothetical protein